MNYRPKRSVRNTILTPLLLLSLLAGVLDGASTQRFTPRRQTKPLPPLPHWTSKSWLPGEAALQIHVLRAALSDPAPLPGATLNVTAFFVVTERIAADYSLNLALVDADGKTLTETHNNLDNKTISLPTSRWKGPVAVTLPIVVPSMARGSLFLMLSLSTWHSSVRVSSAPGLPQDGQSRVYVGAIDVGAKVSGASAAAGTPIDLSHYVPTFEEKFTSFSISDSAINDHSRWYAKNEECCMMASDGKRTEMAAVSGPDNPFLIAKPNGLTIRLQRKGDLWTSGVLTSVDSKGNGFSQEYGYFEMRARFPSGLNTWPAFWLLNTASKRSNAPAGEIDIVEYIANPAFPNYIATTLHDWSDKTTPAMSHSMVDLPTDGFHIYGMLWTAATMTFYFDGEVTFQCPTPAIMHQPYYLLVDLGLGAGWPTVDTPPRNDLEVDYIRVYQAR
jgi:beta-glucanase (GH16 family)